MKILTSYLRYQYYMAKARYYNLKVKYLEWRWMRTFHR